MRRRLLRAAALVSMGALVRLFVGCATASSDPGASVDRCTGKDCGPTTGGDGGTDGLADIGFDVPHIDGGPGDDTTTPPSDSTPPPTDTGSPPPDTSTCTIPAGKTCGWIPQCGCAPGQNCDFTAVDGTVSCVATAGVALNGKCSKLGQCNAGLSCIADICMGFCNTAADCASESGTPICQQITDGGTPPTDIPGYKVCMQQCDPLSPSSICGAGTGCSFVDDSHTTCIAAGTGGEDSSCDASAFSCAPGMTCLDIGTGSKTCLAWCRVGFSDCPISETCNSYTDHPTFAGTEYGFCY